MAHPSRPEVCADELCSGTAVHVTCERTRLLLLIVCHNWRAPPSSARHFIRYVDAPGTRKDIAVQRALSCPPPLSLSPSAANINVKCILLTSLLPSLVLQFSGFTCVWVQEKASKESPFCIFSILLTRSAEALVNRLVVYDGLSAFKADSERTVISRSSHGRRGRRLGYYCCTTFNTIDSSKSISGTTLAVCHNARTATVIWLGATCCRAFWEV